MDFVATLSPLSAFVASKNILNCVDMNVPTDLLVNNVSKPSATQVSGLNDNSCMPQLVPENVPEENAAKEKMPKLLPVEKPKNRVHMAQYIELKLKGIYEEPEEAADDVVVLDNDEEKEAPSISTMAEPQSPCTSSSSKENSVKATPILGSVCKSIVPKHWRPKRPPWLENTEEPVEEEVATNDGDIRSKIMQQLQCLRSKKSDSCSKLVDITVPLVDKYFEKRNPKVTTTAKPNLDIKIVSVVGGSTEFDSIWNEMDKEDCKKDDEVEEKFDGNIINNHLDAPLIKLSKTKDYTKIKGWNHKKILTQNNEADVADGSNDSSKTDNFMDCTDPSPSCSYQLDEFQEDITIKEEEISNIFASDSLDGFLDEQKALKISYNIPTCKSTNKNIDLLDNSVLVDLNYNSNSNDATEEKQLNEEEIREPIVKARTLAQKRKLLLREERKKKKTKVETIVDDSPMLNVPSPEIDVIDEFPLLVPREDFGDDLNDCSTPIVKIRTDGSCYQGAVLTSLGKRIKVNCRTKNETIRVYDKVSHIKRKKKVIYLPKSERKAFVCKPSIFKAKNTKVEYKPGPLCKKNTLQLNHCAEWQTIIKSLPKISVNVKPEVGKKIHPRAAQFVKVNSDCLTSDNVDFALSVLRKSAPPSKKTFNFPVPYAHNQVQVLVRKLSPTKSAVLPNFENYSETIEESVQKVMAGLLNFIEIKELESSIIKEDTDYQTATNEKDEEITKSATDNASKGVKKKRPRTKLNKISHEMNKLNVQVVCLNDEKEPEVKGVQKECGKEFCRLGCVCNSISSSYPSITRCKEAKCCLGCVCGFENSRKSALADRQISAKEMRNLGREHTKDMAKEEKDFAQTVVLTNDQTVCVGTRERRRVPKYNSKKYADFEVMTECHDLEYFKNIIEDDIRNKVCKVELVRCDFDNIVPLCLVHGLHECPCGGMAPLREKKITASDIISSHLQGSGLTLDENALKNCTSRQLPKDVYRERNKSKKHKVQMASYLRWDDTCDKSVVKGWVDPDERQIPAKSISAQIAKTKSSMSPAEAKKLLEKRKVFNKCALQKIAEKLELTHEFMMPNDCMRTKFAELLNKQEVKSPVQFRLFLWDTMIRLYAKRILHIWYTKDNVNKLKFVITVSPEMSEHYRSLRAIEEKVDKSKIKINFIRWVVTRSKPANKDSSDVLVILRLFNSYWEVCGICARNGNTEQKSDTSNDMEIVDTSGKEKEKEKEKEKKKGKEIEKRNDADANGCNDPSYKTVKQVVYIKEEFTMKSLYVILEDGSDLPQSVLGVLDAQLPLLKYSCKWRVLKLSSNFSVLTTKRNEFKIKYSDLITVLKIATKHGKTLRINNPELSRNYMHKQFGIYVTPNYNDRIFIGPYFNYEQHDIETLRFVNNVLVNAETYSKMRGISNNFSTGLWYTCGGRSKPIMKDKAESSSVVDLTDTEINEANGANEADRTIISTEDITITSNILSKKDSLFALQNCSGSKGQRELAETIIDLEKRSDLEIVVVDEGASSADVAEPDKRNLTDEGFVRINPIADGSKANNTSFRIIDNTIISQKAQKLNVESDRDKKDAISYCKPKNGRLESQYCEDVERRIYLEMSEIFKKLGRNLKNFPVTPIMFSSNVTERILVGYESQHHRIVVLFPHLYGYTIYIYRDLKAACSGLEKKLQFFYIPVPSSFKISVEVVPKSLYYNFMKRKLLSKIDIKDIRVVGKFGVVLIKELLASIEATQNSNSVKLSTFTLAKLLQDNEKVMLDFLNELQTCVDHETFVSVDQKFQRSQLIARRTELITKLQYYSIRLSQANNGGSSAVKMPGNLKNLKNVLF